MNAIDMLNQVLDRMEDAEAAGDLAHGYYGDRMCGPDCDHVHPDGE
jgi:hypothetical protein